MIFAEQKAAHPGNPVLFNMNPKPMEMVIRPSHGNLEDVVEISERAVVVNQPPPVAMPIFIKIHPNFNSHTCALVVSTYHLTVNRLTLPLPLDAVSFCQDK